MCRFVLASYKTGIQCDRQKKTTADNDRCFILSLSLKHNHKAIQFSTTIFISSVRLKQKTVFCSVTLYKQDQVENHTNNIAQNLKKQTKKHINKSHKTLVVETFFQILVLGKNISFVKVCSRQNVLTVPLNASQNFFYS